MTSTSNSCKDGVLKSNEDGVCELEEKLQNMSVADISVCANCGKEGSSDNMNTCNKCKQVKYCNAVCKKVHKKKHKKECEEYVRLAAEKHDEELRLAAEKHDIELFKEPLSAEDCPICFLRLPTLQSILNSGTRYMSCCGKVICNGCFYAPVYDNQGNEVTEKVCPFCRTPEQKSYEEGTEREKIRVEVNDPFAIYNLGCDYFHGGGDVLQDHTKGLELWHRAVELGYDGAYNNIGYAYKTGHGVEVDEKKALYYYELAAMRGDAHARHNLGIIEEKAGNFDRALKHFTIAVRGGFSQSLQQIKSIYSKGYATKDDYTKALQSYQEYLAEIKSRQRDEAAAANEDYRYY